jgi:hypothetical protein
VVAPDLDISLDRLHIVASITDPAGVSNCAALPSSRSGLLCSLGVLQDRAR